MFCFEDGGLCVVQVDSELVNSSNPPSSASGVAGAKATAVPLSCAPALLILLQ
jgi:hypothetical protein